MAHDDKQSTSAGNTKVPTHVAIIMDGNGRWAKKRLLPRVEGHRAGAKTVRMIVEECRRAGVKYLTLFTFSSENWHRPKDEIASLMKLLEDYLRNEIPRLIENGIRLRAIGDLSKLSAGIRTLLEDTARETQDLNGLQLILALSYGGRDEITSAAQRLCREAKEGLLDPDTISAEDVARCLYAPDVPDPDLLIRTSDEFRISNFLLWELAYSEIVVSPLLWPEFSKEEFHRCLEEYEKRERRFGLTGEQINGNQ